MPKIRDSAVTIELATVTTSILKMPEHQTGDLLLVFFNKDTPSGGPTLPGGWSNLPTNVNPMNSVGAGNYFFAKRATSAAETLTLTYTSETSLTLVLAVKNCAGTTVNHAIGNQANASADDSTLPFSGGTLTTTNNNMLVIGYLGTDAPAGGLGPSAMSGFVNIFGGDNVTDCLCVGYTHKATAGLVTHPGYWAFAEDDTKWLMLSINDDGNNSEVDPYLDMGTVSANQISIFAGANTIDSGTWAIAAGVTLLNIRGKTVTGVIQTAAADSGYNPFQSAVRHIAPSSLTGLGQSQLTLTAAQNMTYGTGVLFGTYRPQLPRDYIDMGSSSQGGTFLRLADAGNNTTTWLVGAQFSKTTQVADVQNYAIQVGQTSSTNWAANGVLANTAVNRVYIGGSGYYGACSIEWSKLCLLNTAVLAGGTPTNKLTLDNIRYAVNQGSGELPLIKLAGSAATIWTRLQFGGGEPFHCDINLSTFQYPKKADGTNYLDFHVDNNVLGIEFYGKSNDNIIITNSVFTSDSPYYWRFNGAHNSNTVVNMQGSSVVKGTVTLNANTNLNRMSFISCPTFTQNSATLTNMTFSNTVVTTDNVSRIQVASFTSGGTGHALVTTGPTGTYTVNTCTYTGYASTDGSTGNEVFYNNSGGSITLNVSGGNVPTIRNGAGAATTVIATVTITLTGMKDNSEVRVYTAGTTTELAGIENATTGTTDNRSFAFNVTPATSIDIRVFNVNWISDDIFAYTVPSTSTSIPIAQRIDRVYANL